MAEKQGSFEASLKRLEEITKLLESADTPLEQALALFEEGTKLVRELTGALDEAQQKVVLLTGVAENKPTEEAFAAPQA